ncbi:hypothetical protein BGX26_006384 [Mortierella sp. AD094]|nr:hypothetical protein BGX26_006384 [Mortierella sp. AD094]
MLLLSPAIEGKVNRSWVRKSAYVGTELSDREADVIVQIVNGLRPYTPKQQPRTNGNNGDGSKDEGHKSGTPHMSLRAPMILVANKILRVCGYNDYTRRLCPQISSGAVYALPLPALGIYEVLCAKKAGHFDVHDICKKNGLEFADCMTYVDAGTVIILGSQLQHGLARSGYPIKDMYDTRRSSRRNNSSFRWGEERLTCGKSNDELEAEASNADTRVKKLEKEQREAKKSEKTITLQVQRHGYHPDSDEYIRLKKAQDKSRADLLRFPPKLREARQERYYYNKLLSSKPASVSTKAIQVTTSHETHTG